MSKISNFSFSEAATNSLASHVTYALITGNPISGPFIAASACIASVAYLFKESNRFEPKLESAAKSLMLGVAQGALFGTMHKICFVVARSYFYNSIIQSSMLEHAKKQAAEFLNTCSLPLYDYFDLIGDEIQMRWWKDSLFGFQLPNFLPPGVRVFTQTVTQGYQSVTKTVWRWVAVSPGNSRWVQEYVVEQVPVFKDLWGCRLAFDYSTWSKPVIAEYKIRNLNSVFTFLSFLIGSNQP